MSKDGYEADIPEHLKIGIDESSVRAPASTSRVSHCDVIPIFVFYLTAALGIYCSFW